MDNRKLSCLVTIYVALSLCLQIILATGAGKRLERLLVLSSNNETFTFESGPPIKDQDDNNNDNETGQFLNFQAQNDSFFLPEYPRFSRLLPLQNSSNFLSISNDTSASLIVSIKSFDYGVMFLNFSYFIGKLEEKSELQANQPVETTNDTKSGLYVKVNGDTVFDNWRGIRDKDYIFGKWTGSENMDTGNWINTSLFLNWGGLTTAHDVNITFQWTPVAGKDDYEFILSNIMISTIKQSCRVPAKNIGTAQRARRTDEGNAIAVAVVTGIIIIIILAVIIKKKIDTSTKCREDPRAGKDGLKIEGRKT